MYLLSLNWTSHVATKYVLVRILMLRGSVLVYKFPILLVPIITDYWGNFSLTQNWGPEAGVFLSIMLYNFIQLSTSVVAQANV